MLKNYGMANVSEIDRKVAFRHWLTASQYLREALEKMIMVAHDEGELSSDAAEEYWTSCTLRRTFCLTTL